MLTELHVRDLGVIDELSLVLGDGMTVVTGETGAGKTLVVSAIDLLTGGRADASLVRPGADEAEIQGRFSIGGPGDGSGSGGSGLGDGGVPGSGDGGDSAADELVVRRVIPRQGRSRVYVNGHMATLAALSEHAGDLVDLHGQHSHQSLLRGPVQRALLDRFGDVDTSRLAALIDDLRATEAELAGLGGDQRARAREIDLLRHQAAEIDEAALADADEDRRLDAEETLLADAVAHREAAAEAVAALDGDGPAADALASAIGALDQRAPFADLVARLHDAAAELSDVAAEARSRAESIDDDPRRLEELRNRRALLVALRRKYGETLSDVMAFGAEASARLAELESYEERAEAAEQRRAELSRRLDGERAVVLAARREAAPRLAAEVQQRLAGLAMAEARVEVSVNGPAGDDVVIELAANAGHDPQPLAKVASGGELARAMLALRLVLTSGPPTLVFDEVDAGIGGEVARTVGASLAALAPDHQVLVVTHLAQVAAFADHHVTVAKRSVDGASLSAAGLLDDQARLVELSRMLSGSPDSASAREHAEELIEASRSHRAALGRA